MLTIRAPAPHRCPECGSVDWFRDGCIIAAPDDQIELHCGRVQHSDPALASTTWSCTHCAHEEPSTTRLARALDAVRHGTCDHPEGG